MRIVHTVTFKAKFKWCIFYHYKVISLISIDCMVKWISYLTSDKISSSKSVEGTFKYIFRSVGVLSSCQINAPIRRDFSIL